MHMTAELRASVGAQFDTFVATLRRIPDGQHFEMRPMLVGEHERIGLLFQCATQADVRTLRACFPGAFWAKRYATVGWWEYTTVWEGIPLEIYACREAPPTCRLVTETVTEEERVPVAYETRVVTKERTRWECDGAGMEE